MAELVAKFASARVVRFVFPRVIAVAHLSDQVSRARISSWPEHMLRLLFRFHQISPLAAEVVRSRLLLIALSILAVGLEIDGEIVLVALTWRSASRPSACRFVHACVVGIHVLLQSSLLRLFPEIPPNKQKIYRPHFPHTKSAPAKRVQPPPPLALFF